MASINIIDGNDKQFSQDHIPELLNKALAISFDQDIGHDYYENAEDRYDFYHTLEEKVPFDLDIFNKITKGGLPGKSLSVILASTGAGKSLFMCHLASYHSKIGKNVLYISLEMAEERIGERLDCNILDITFDELDRMDKETFLTKINKAKKRSPGRLVLKEYPTSSASAAHFRALLEELKVKKNFKPDIIFIDYLGICASARYKNSGNVNSYNYSKSVAEELRGLGMAYNVPVVTAVQVNRSGTNNSDPEWENVAESHGIAMTADLFFALYASEEMQQLNQIMVKLMKNRWNSLDFYRRFLIGVDKSKMKLYNLEQPNGNISMPDSKTEMASKPSLSFDNWS
jgi:replicative DNA helicase